MSIVRLSSLSAVELLLLGNNLDAATRCSTVSRKRNNRRIVCAVNRSLARLGERVGCLHRPASAQRNRQSCGPTA